MNLASGIQSLRIPNIRRRALIVKHRTEKTSYPDRKISETFLDFSSPLLEVLGAKVTKDQIEEVLKITFTIWNAVVLDKLRGNTHYVTMLRESITSDPLASAMVEQMIMRKQDMFADDHRLIGEYRVRYKHGEWRFWVEAREPATIT